MSTYKAFTRTCYFHVNDEAAFRTLMETVIAHDGDGGGVDIHIFTKPDDAGNKTFAFGAYGSIMGLRVPDESDGDSDFSVDAFIKALQDCLVDGDVVILAEIGREKMNFWQADAYIISKTKHRFMDFHDMVVEAAGDLEPNWPEGTNLDY